MLSLNNKISNGRDRLKIKFYFASLVKVKRSPDSGFSLLESLIAVAVVSILIVAIAPMVALSTSARANARRIDQATQAARGYIDAVKGGAISTTNFPDTLVVRATNAQAQYTFESVVVPTTTTFPIATVCGNIANNVSSGTVPGVCVDSNGSGFDFSDPQDFIIQPMRSGPLKSSSTVSTDLVNQGFWLAVRVYRADAFASGNALQQGTEPACTGKPAFASSAPFTCPIVTLRSQIYLPRSSTDLIEIGKGIGASP